MDVHCAARVFTPLQLQQLQVFWEQGFGVFMAIWDHLPRGTLVRSDSDVGREGPAHRRRLCSNSPQRCEIRTRSVRFFHTKHHHPCLYGSFFVQWGSAMWEQEGATPKLCHQQWQREIVPDASVGWSVKSSCHRNSGADPEKQPQQSSQTSTVLLATARPRQARPVFLKSKYAIHSFL